VPVPKRADDGIVQSVIALDEDVDEGLCGRESLASHPPKQCRLRGVIVVKRFPEEFIRSNQGRVGGIRNLGGDLGP
jgi:hypothetical protein